MKYKGDKKGKGNSKRFKDYNPSHRFKDLSDRLLDEAREYDLTKQLTGFLGLGSLVIALYFLAPNFTGNVIGNIELGNSNLTGVLLFIFGIVNIFMCTKCKCK